MPKVALVYPYFRTRSPMEILFPPLGSASLASQLHRLGIETRIFDCTFESFEQVEKSIVAYQPDIVGIYTMVTLSRNTFRIAEMVRAKLPDSLFAAGGPLPTLYPERFSAQFDVVFRGEADLSFPRFCQDCVRHMHSKPLLQELPLDTYAGLFINKPELQVDNPMVTYREDEIETFPLPDRSGFDHAAYQKIWLRNTGIKTTSLMTTYGCPFSCDFCSKPVFGNLFRRRNLDTVFAEVEQIRRLGYDSLWIADDNFTLSHSYLQEFSQRMAGKNMSWTCLSRTTGIDDETARLMKEGGCSRVYLGLESGSQDTLKLMNKRASLDDAHTAVHHFRNAGVEVAAFFIVGYPGETVSSIEETFRFALDLPLDAISFNVPFPLPGSKLFERVSGIDTNKDWNTENEVTFVYNSEFDPGWLRTRIDQTMQAFAEKRK